MGYTESISYQKYCDCVITDSGGIQKEAYILQKQCFTLRSETEWNETLQNGWNTLIFDNLFEISSILQHKPYDDVYVDHIYGNGLAAEEITAIIKKHI